VARLTAATSELLANWRRSFLIDTQCERATGVAILNG
jgi:hypothetical protein